MKTMRLEVLRAPISSIVSFIFSHYIAFLCLCIFFIASLVRYLLYFVCLCSCTDRDPPAWRYKIFGFACLDQDGSISKTKQPLEIENRCRVEEIWSLASSKIDRPLLVSSIRRHLVYLIMKISYRPLILITFMTIFCTWRPPLSDLSLKPGSTSIFTRLLWSLLFSFIDYAQSIANT